jgi:hypothetical protein
VSRLHWAFHPISKLEDKNWTIGILFSPLPPKLPSPLFFWEDQKLRSFIFTSPLQILNSPSWLYFSTLILTPQDRKFTNLPPHLCRLLLCISVSPRLYVSIPQQQHLQYSMNQLKVASIVQFYFKIGGCFNNTSIFLRI